MVKCRNKDCRNELDEEDLFCDECGFSVEAAPPVNAEQSEVLCPNIGRDGNRCLKPLQSGKKFCRKCGWQINPVIFQPGSVPCTRTKENGDICRGIIEGKTKVCTVCSSTVDYQKDNECEVIISQREHGTVTSAHPSPSHDSTQPSPEEVEKIDTQVQNKTQGLFKILDVSLQDQNICTGKTAKLNDGRDVSESEKDEPTDISKFVTSNEPEVEQEEKKAQSGEDNECEVTISQREHGTVTNAHYSPSHGSTQPRPLEEVKINIQVQNETQGMFEIQDVSLQDQNISTGKELELNNLQEVSESEKDKLTNISKFGTSNVAEVQEDEKKSRCGEDNECEAIISQEEDSTVANAHPSPSHDSTQPPQVEEVKIKTQLQNETKGIFEIQDVSLQDQNICTGKTVKLNDSQEVSELEKEKLTNISEFVASKELEAERDEKKSQYGECIIFTSFENSPDESLIKTVDGEMDQHEMAFPSHYKASSNENNIAALEQSEKSNVEENRYQEVSGSYGHSLITPVQPETFEENDKWIPLVGFGYEHGAEKWSMDIIQEINTKSKIAMQLKEDLQRSANVENETSKPDQRDERAEVMNPLVATSDGQNRHTHSEEDQKLPTNDNKDCETKNYDSKSNREEKNSGYTEEQKSSDIKEGSIKKMEKNINTEAEKDTCNEKDKNMSSCGELVDEGSPTKKKEEKLSEPANGPITSSQNSSFSPEKGKDSQNVNWASVVSKGTTAVNGNMQSKPKGRDLNQHSVEEVVEVTFHGILSPSLLENAVKVSIMYSIGKSLEVKSSQSKCVRIHGDDYVEYKTTIIVPRCAALNRLFYYFYQVTPAKGDTKTEYLYDTTGSNIHRILHTSENSIRRGHFHQYDGIVDTKPHKWYNKLPYFGVKGNEKSVKNNAEKAFQVFIEEAKDDLVKERTTAEEFLDSVEDIKTGLHHVYYEKARLWDSVYGFDQFIRINLKPVVAKMIDINSSCDGKSYLAVLVIAVAIAHLYETYAVEFDDNIILLFQQMEVPLEKDTACKAIENFKTQYPSKLRIVASSLQRFINNFASWGSSARWLFCVPLLHLICGKCKPYETPSDNTEHDVKEPVWWGVEAFEHSLDCFKSKSSWNINMKKTVEKMAPMFALDYFFPRTLMTIVKFQNYEEIISSKHIPVDICLASLYRHLVASVNLHSHHEVIQRCLIKLSQRLITEFQLTSIEGVSKDSLFNLYRMYTIGYDFFLKVVEGWNYDKMTGCRAAAVVIQAIGLFDILMKKLDKSLSEDQKPVFKRSHIGILQDCKQKLNSWLENSLYYLYSLERCQSFLKLWDIILDLKLPGGSKCDEIIDQLSDDLESAITMKMKDSTNDQLLVDVYCEYLDNYGKRVQNILSKVAVRALSEGKSSRVGCQRNKKGRYGKLLSEVFEKQWMTLTDEQLFMKALTWSPFQHFLQMFYGEEKSKFLSENCTTQLAKAASVLLEKMTLLDEGQICITDLIIISKHFDVFKKLLMILMKKNEEPIEEIYFVTLLDIRKKELEAFQRNLEHVKDFMELCSQIKVETTDIEDILTGLDDINSKSIHELCKPGILSRIIHPYKYEPKVTAFKLGGDILEVLPDVVKNKDSCVFINKWIETGHEAMLHRRDALTVKETLDEVWKPVQRWWMNLCEMMENGKMSFEVFDSVFKNMDEKELKWEFTFFFKDRDSEWITKRITQIRQYRELQSCAAGAKTILEVVRSYNLQGDFDAIKKITDVMEGSDMEVKDMDETMIKACRLLRGFSQVHIACLKEFVACKPLVIWLKNSMPSGLKELKVFADLASISAGEGDMELAKVKCLHAATTGYAPLIFSLDNDINYRVFLQKCDTVWKELKADPDLPTKLRDTSRELTWLKTVKKAHGSVEVTCLTQVEVINSIGIYQIGKILREIKGNKPVLEEVICLYVSEDKQGTRPEKKYDYGQLHDLQSRLMLVAGKAEKGKDDVDRFTSILDTVIRIGSVYTKLLSAGCVLFSNWKMKLLCERARKVCCFITFGEGEDAGTLKGRKEKEEDEVSSIVPRIARFMENCLTEWLQYINEKRDRYYHLNFFTIDQMVILQKELVKVGTKEKPSDLIFSLLSAIKRDCSMLDIVEAMKEAQQQVEKKNIYVENEKDIVGKGEVRKDDSEEITSFITDLIQVGNTEALAKKASKLFKPDQVEEAIVWCMDQDDEVEVESDSYGVRKQQEEINTPTETFQGWRSNPKSVSAVTAEILGHLTTDNRTVSLDPLIENLESVWQTFLNSISSSVSDYLSVEHLGLILRQLAEKEMFAVNRDFLQCFKSGMPNLIICPQADLLNTMLTIYMHSPRQALPQPDEVLICSSHTTLDQLDIFWRRAVFQTSGRIYCLVNGDLLDYDVSDKGELCLEYHMEKATEKGIDYRLVVLCSAENEFKSRIVAALDRFRRPHLPVANRQAIRQYLQRQFRVDNITDKVVSAARVDFDQSTVRVVKSWRAGVGKTLYKERLEAELNHLCSTVRRKSEVVVTIPMYEREIDVDTIMSILLEFTPQPGHIEPRIFHIDISHEVYVGVDAFLFHLLILGCLSNSAGYVWRKSPHDHYLVETMPQISMEPSVNKKEVSYLHKSLEVLPDMICRSPEESLDILSGGKKPPDYSDNDRLFDHQEFVATVFQRPYQYLKHLDENKKLTDIDPYRPQGDEINCLQILLRHCGMRDPSWAELKHFVWFLNSQLQDFEVSAFCGLAAMEDLPGFAKFVLKFLIQMSRDFATRSLNISEESPVQKLQYLALQDEEEMDTGNEEQFIQQFQMRRTWESSPHPYIFFNPDHNSMTFLGFNIDRRTGDLVDLQTGNVLERCIMDKNLQESLTLNRVNINENFDALPRGDKIEKLCRVIGIDKPYDPDETYELTTDNVKKILAIYMRFKCDIPVIIMGETGCGKTRLVKFMCSLQCPPGVAVQNMIIMKVHGGIKSTDIMKKVRYAEEMAKENSDKYGQHLQTVLFFDEANTTEAIGLIKEIMCDKTLGGKPLKLCESLKIIAACNPYRKHSDELIQRLEQAGLGYHVDADSTTDKLGRIPMRRLVYKVQPLPRSLLPLVWDFGHLDIRVEELYIRQMVLRYINNRKLPNIKYLENIVSRILTVSQDFMRGQKDECSFVSLRDVERVLEVMSWFYGQAMGDSSLFRMIDEMQEEDSSQDEEEYFSADDKSNFDSQEFCCNNLSYVTRSLILALGVCYHACLKNREAYRETVARHFIYPCPLPGGADRMLQEIERCQDVFLNNVQLGKNIAQNQALKENVFMMVTCIELRIPLFLVGKPGSSKSLAKTIVADAMQGYAAHKRLFREYKTAQMVSFQCSPLSVPEGIVGTFRQCATFQKGRDLDTFVSVVVLDEVGLAEDSPRMPLKTLHPLLEDGCEGDEVAEPHKKVAFIGISNWALDPAKMNRGILVQRDVPELKELTQSAEGICSSDKMVLRYIQPVIGNMAESYLEIFQEASKQFREFFGLRDFYSLLKMVYAFADKYKKKPSWKQLKHAILRNFGGMEGINPVEVFTRKLTTIDIREKPSKSDPNCTPAGLIQACLEGDGNESESRYLLLLTENYGALNILQQKMLNMHNAITIFGSSFPSDQEYTQVCRNINRIKVCMETGSTVVLLNLENLYESLYDALNQYYVEFGGERYVDLGLGSHRVKCRVHKQFRLIVVAEKQTVYDKFPIPLINRLEKHFLNISTMLTPVQLNLAEKLESWTKDFAKIQPHFTQRRKRKSEVNASDVFMGYHADMCASVILHVMQKQNLDAEMEGKKILEEAKKSLLWCATPDAVMRLSLSPLKSEEDVINNIYFVEQQHECLSDYLYQQMYQEGPGIFAQITTHSKLITAVDLGELSKVLKIPHKNMVLLTLQSFDSEQQFCRQIRCCLENKEEGEESLLVVQSDCGDQNSSLVACARYCIQDELQEISNSSVHVVFIIQLPRVAGGCFSGFQCGRWHSLHIDDLRPAGQETLAISDMRGQSVGMLIHRAVANRPTHHNKMDTPDIEAGLPEENDIMDDHRQKSEHVQMEVDQSNIHVNTVSNGIMTHYRLPIYKLIFSCIQSALAMVKDTKVQKSRETERVAIMLKMLHQSNEMNATELMLGLGMHLDLLLQEKEKTSANAQNWLAAEAARAEYVNTAGTFRRAWMHCMEAKIISVLAGIIAFIDTNNNLDCLSKSAPDSWRQQLWMEVINCPQATGIQYNKQLVSPGRNAEVTEVMVVHTGAEGHLFTGDMPFSWLIFKLIEDAVKTAFVTRGESSLDDTEIIMKTRDVIMNTPIGKILQPVVEQNIQEAIQAYLRDFVHLIYPVKTDQEHQLVCESMYTGTRAILEGQFGDGLAVVVGFHVSYRRYASRLKNFSNLNRVWTQCSSAVIEFQSKTPTFFLITDEEMTLDVLGLHLLLEMLKPEQGILNKDQGRNEWLMHVHLYRPVIERIIDMFLPGNVTENTKYGKRCCMGISHARLIWTSVLVVKMFLEHVYSMTANSDNDQFFAKSGMTLWTMIKSGVDMKKLQSLEKIEKFLKMFNKTATSQIFGISKENNACKNCESPFEGPPVTLSCEHIICTKCLNDLKVTKDMKCPICATVIRENFNSSPDRMKNQLYAKYFDYKRRCNSFFVEVVSQLCFADGTAPDSDVVEKLMKYITRETKSQKVVTKEMSIFDDDIDPTPVLRSFLLQLVLRTNSDQVYQYLEAYMKHANCFVNVGNEQDPQLIQLCLLIVPCIEDSYHHEVSRSESPETEEVSMALNMLENAKGVILENKESWSVHSLHALAQARFGLMVAAKYVQEIYVVKSRETDKNLRRLLEAASQLCQKCGTKWPCIFFVKYLCRCYGMGSYEVVRNLNDSSMREWIQILSLRDEKLECTDNYVVCGQQYAELRELVTKCLLGEKTDSLEEKIQELQEPVWKKRTWLMLAVYREITMSNVYPEDKRQSMLKTVGPLAKFLTGSALFQGQEQLIMVLVQNTIWKKHDRLNIREGLGLQDQSIACLLVHALITILQLPAEKTLLHPLLSLALAPHTMVNAYLPTMPQDELEDIKEALLEGRKHSDFSENPVLYRCPNGHPYVIGNCGRPYYIATCKECGAQIGGKNHELLPGNQKDTGEDRTQPGHILGRAQDRVVAALTERKMTPVTCATLRLMTHIFMMLGANENSQAIYNMIRPNIEENEVHEFLLSHIKLDITIIQKATGYSSDDVVLLMHNLLATMLNTHKQGEFQTQELCDLATKDRRKRWEEMFIARYITPLLQTMDNDLKMNNNLIASDKRLGSDHLLCLLYETDSSQEVTDHLCDVPALWRYRKRISMDHLTTEFHNQMKDNYKVLQLFLKEELQLRTLRLVPNIMRLQKMLIQKYQRKLDRSEANTNLTLSEVEGDFERDGKEEEVHQLILDFGEAWNSVRESLSNFPCPTIDGYTTLSREYCCRQVTMDTNVSMLLPSQRDVGLCSYILLYYLLKKQNSFLDNYYAVKKQRTKDLPKVKVADITPAHLISYHPDRDILSIVLANCNYSFEVGQGTTITYDFQNIERQLMDRFLFSKSYIEIDEIEVMTYRSDATNSAVFASLRDKIYQEKLGAAVRRQISEEFKSSLPEICDCLDNLDITISFLKSVGEDPDCSLDRFMTNTLKMRNSLFNQKARQSCQCKHAQSLWITLSLEKTKCLAMHNRNAYDGIRPEFCKEMTGEQTKALQYFCDELQMDKLDILIECLFECLMLRLTIAQNPEDEDYVDVQRMSLRDFLMAHMESPLYDNDVTYPNWMMEVLGMFSADFEDPNYLQVSHAVEVWLCMYECYRRKGNKRHR